MYFLKVWNNAQCCNSVVCGMDALATNGNWFPKIFQYEYEYGLFKYYNKIN